MWGKYIDIIVSMCYNTSKRKENTMKTGYIYWNAFYEYLINNFKLNGDLTNDAKVIKETQYLWQEASKRYLKNVKAKDFVSVWCDIECLNNNVTYEDFYNRFMDSLYYATDRMNINRWLCLQMNINRAKDLIYEAWTGQHYWHDWTKEIESGWSDTQSCTTKLQEDCANEFKTIIKPLIVKNQELERKTKIKNEIQN